MEEPVATLNLKNLPDPLYRKLRAQAKRERRSMSQEVIHLLVETLDRSEPLSILELQGLGKECWNRVDASSHIEAERRSWD
jgi:plasmid stability protein